ncbi:calcium-dependent protein kinase CDPK9 [Toxoplasma gondii TgCatPRC2]|uniref:non-specific serine/threonine protein kinase n=14 Tax=Toxoplasma gondii TaxID=5811 RepID=S7V1I8_TOXGG|nr:calcium-dependent protein kinase CDPK9 [Toxoplasma gondii ME49]EPR63861.1 calcium-dependent protein kinase CDPK9 [Toxoplasma gondii GT1]KAF4638345.1 calcium-dependent protein kinase CDPK9 [Toxoplasma gondii]KFG37807.1 calcium-dependent protein kinase CDPK9 [Toxoplasma gondii p89]KFH05296.1 calcium-dependent protein kinase CDPK9 [Toxoplasma gondii VAND]KYK67011.1 calcium-dependent protein kinase CDPK9 [Toxoplasma gondii TgCatPRC2]PIM04915.1 calcium-dependent protein kinase CDPK9 [Toxoplasma|eukprot:XP_018634858.1 calcium-dependent protein kinase CDPK9 [Toxoplasma gondii ME49]
MPETKGGGYAERKLRIADPFGDDNEMLQRLTEEAFNSVSNGKPTINLMQASTGLEFALKRLHPVCPLPDKVWYPAVFRNYDLDRDGEIDKEAFIDILQQYHAYHYARLVKRQQRHHGGQVTVNVSCGSATSQRRTAIPGQSATSRAGLGAGGNVVDNKEQSLVLASYIMYPAHHGICEVYKDYIFGETAGKGSFGKVQLVTNKKTGARRACKSIGIQSPDQWELIKAEIELLKALNHPNIMKLYETYQDGYTIYLIIELCHGGPLFDRIVQHYEKLRSPITEEQVSHWMRQILSACAYCHERGVVHRDLKPENILFVDSSPDSPIKVIDFGLSDTMQRLRETAKEVKEKRGGVGGAVARLLPSFNGRHIIPWYVRRVRMQRAGTPHYMAPEMIRGDYDERCDLFAVGIIMYQLLSGIHPFYVPGLDNEETVKSKILTVDPPTTGEEWQCVTSQAKDLVRKLIVKNPKKRLSAAQALEHPWFQFMQGRQAKPSQLTASVFEGLRNWQNQNRLKQAVLQLLAKELNETDILELRKKFEALDQKGDGTITIDELKESMHNAGYKVIESELAAIVDSIDAQHQGFIGYNEFISALLLRRMTLQEEQLREVFNKFDVRGEGCLTMESLRKALKGSRYGQLTDEELKLIFAEVDKNNDGYVDFYEFCDLMTS